MRLFERKSGSALEGVIVEARLLLH